MKPCWSSADAGDEPRDVLRLWESTQQAVIVGRGSRVDQEVQLDYCQSHRIPILRRCSGGAAVVIGPGCLMYSTVLTLDRHPELRIIDRAHRFVLQRIADGLRGLGLPVRMSGTSDLTINGRKFSGNSLRCKRNTLLYHGTLLCGLSLPLISDCLRMPPRRPSYREDRSHSDFLMQLPVSSQRLRQTLADAWSCDGRCESWPRDRTEPTGARAIHPGRVEPATLGLV